MPQRIKYSDWEAGQLQNHINNVLNSSDGGTPDWWNALSGEQRNYLLAGTGSGESYMPPSHLDFAQRVPNIGGYGAIGFNPQDILRQHQGANPGMFVPDAQGEMSIPDESYNFLEEFALPAALSVFTGGAGMGGLGAAGAAGAAGEGAAWGAGLGGADLAAMEGAVGLMGEGAAWGAGLGGADLSAMESAVGGLGSAAGATGAAGGTAGTSGSSNAASSLMRILKGEGKPDDYINVLGAAGPAALGMYGSSRQAEGLRDLSAANRADREPFLNAAKTWLTNPGAYAAGPGQQTLDAVLRKLSAGFGNPIGAPTAMNIATSAALGDWRDAVTGMANLGLGGQDTRATFDIGALGADKKVFDMFGTGVRDLTTSPKSLTDLLKELKGVLGAAGALA